MRQYNQQYEEWVGLPVDRNFRSSALPPPQPVPLEADRLVCMWDGATGRGSHSAGGIVIMTPARGVLMAGEVQFPGIDDPMVVEVLVLREAIMWCLNQVVMAMGRGGAGTSIPMPRPTLLRGG
ncbi:unnamed protein product [Linum trigynum]|uniref:RNase H type-1 domain-containing protein n=1 Tax=Linum trigynum TaxID=586398 RepID=A0AAV2CBD2_9ROSI